jgi:hypothetical protein
MLVPVRRDRDVDFPCSDVNAGGIRLVYRRRLLLLGTSALAVAPLGPG